MQGTTSMKWRKMTTTHKNTQKHTHRQLDTHISSYMTGDWFHSKVTLDKSIGPKVDTCLKSNLGGCCVLSVIQTVRFCLGADIVWPYFFYCSILIPDTLHIYMYVEQRLVWPTSSSTGSRRLQFWTDVKVLWRQNGRLTTRWNSGQYIKKLRSGCSDSRMMLTSNWYRRLSKWTPTSWWNLRQNNTDV